MKLHRVKLRNYRGVVESDVEFSLNGVTIIEGPNEIGKTAIAEGLQLAIDLPDSSTNSRVKAVQPVGRDEGPGVEISLSSGEYELVYSKRWLRRASTVLEVKGPHRESLTGRQAHDRVKAILDETLDQELWRALRIQQGTELTLPNFGLLSMGRALDQVAGGELVTDREETLWTRISDEYNKYWTPTGQVRSDRKASERRVQEARVEVAELEKQIQEIESDVARMSRLVDESARLSESVKEFEKNENELEQLWNEIDRLQSEVERLDAVHSAARAQFDSASSGWQRRQDQITNLEDSAKALMALEAEAEDAVPGLVSATRRNEDAASALREAESALTNARERLTRAIADRDYLRQLIEVEQLKERNGRYLTAERTLKEAEEYLESARVDDEVASQIEDAYLEYERARSAAGSAAASIEITALTDIDIEVGDELIELTGNEVRNALVEDEVTLTFPGVARMRVSAGSEARGFTDQYRRTRENYRHLCDEVGVADVSEARRVAQDRQEAQRNREEAINGIERELRDLTPDILIGKVNNLTERVSSYPKERPESPPLPGDLDGAQEIEAEVSMLLKECEAKLRECENTARNAEAELQEVRLDEASRAANSTLLGELSAMQPTSLP